MTIQRKNTYFVIMLLTLLACLLIGCGTNSDSNAKQPIIDYGDAESFEAALNAGENLEGKIVQITFNEFL